MTRDEALECVRFIEACWQPHELMFYTAEEVVNAISPYGFPAVRRALSALVRIEDAAPPLWKIQNWSNWFDRGEFLYANTREAPASVGWDL